MSKRGENIYKRKDGRWEGRYIKCRTLQGKIQYGYVYGKSYSEAKAKLKENASTPIRASTNQMAQFTLYGEILKVWLLSAKNRVKESTISRYNHIVQRHIQPFLGNYQISEIGAALLEEYIDYLLQHGRLDGSGGLSPKSVADIIVVIKSSMRYAQENGYRINCSTTGLSVKRSKKDMRVLSKKEQQQLECVLMQDTDLTKFMVLLCLYTGIRIGEACALRWEHLQLDSGILKVRETMQRIQAPQNIAAKTRVIITEPKSACSKRDIPLPKFLIQYAAQFQTDMYPVMEEAYNDLITGKVIIRDSMIDLFCMGGVFDVYIAMVGIVPEEATQANYLIIFDWIFEHLDEWSENDINVDHVGISVYSDMLEKFIKRFGFEYKGLNPAKGKVYEATIKALKHNSLVKKRYPHFCQKDSLDPDE